MISHFTAICLTVSLLIAGWCFGVGIATNNATVAVVGGLFAFIAGAIVGNNAG